VSPLLVAADGAEVKEPRINTVVSSHVKHESVLIPKTALNYLNLIANPSSMPFRLAL
jgi:hypothetical protein